MGATADLRAFYGLDTPRMTPEEIIDGMINGAGIGASSHLLPWVLTGYSLAAPKVGPDYPLSGIPCRRVAKHIRMRKNAERGAAILNMDEKTFQAWWDSEDV